MADPVAFQVFLVWFLEHEAVTSKSTEVCIDRSSIKTCPEFAPASHTFVSCKPETAAVLKRTVEALMENGAVVRNLENLGERALPYKISKHKQRHRRGGYFLVDLEAPPSIVSTMMDHLGRDIDVIRRAFIKHPVSKTEECSGIVPVSFEDKLTAKKK
uniref:Small ribosomal subunit protein bS6m n=2 Tax=Anas platyrhynchos TaxID=8839 RepID=A0A493TBH7_ANAPP